MSRFLDALRTQPLLFDGAMGTALIAAGLDLSKEPPEAWLLSHPETIQSIHTAFTPHADALQTNTFGLLRLLRSTHPVCATLNNALDLARLSVALTTPKAVGPTGNLFCGPRAAKMIAGKGAHAACSADEASAASAHPASPKPWIIATLGPSGPPPTQQDAAQLRTWVTDLSHAFAEAGADALHLETTCDPTELATLLEGAWAGPLPVLVSMTVSLGQSGMETPLGVPLQRMLRVIEEGPGLPIAIGVNCSLPARRMRRAVAELAEWAAARRGKAPRVLAQPQVDEPAPDCKRPPTPETPERFANDLLLLREEGAELLGGCCGCRPEHIAAVRAALNAEEERRAESRAESQAESQAES